MIKSIVLFATAAAAIPLAQVNWDHFATEESAKSIRGIDLTSWGYDTNGGLPLSYDLVPEMAYNATATHDLYFDIIGGHRNRTLETPEKSKRDDGLNERATSYLHMDLYGSDSSCVDSYQESYKNNNCNSGIGCAPWSSVNVYSATNTYVTFWTSSVCNGNKASINPGCNGNSLSCSLSKLAPSSYRVYNGCHSQYASGACN